MSERETLHVPRRAERTTREQEEVHEPVHGEEELAPWQQPMNLPAIPARPGYGQRWIRVAVHGKDDGMNLSKALRAGYSPRQWDTVPKHFYAPQMTDGQWSGCVGVADMILCEIPEKHSNAMKARIAAQTNRITQAVEHDLEKESHPKMPITQTRRSEVEFGRRRPKVQDDDS